MPPPDMQASPGGVTPKREPSERDASGAGGATTSSHRHHRERIGPYVVDGEIGRGSFATVFKGHRSVSRQSFITMSNP